MRFCRPSLLALALSAFLICGVSHAAPKTKPKASAPHKATQVKPKASTAQKAPQTKTKKAETSKKVAHQKTDNKKTAKAQKTVSAQKKPSQPLQAHKEPAQAPQKKTVLSSAAPLKDTRVSPLPLVIKTPSESTPINHARTNAAVPAQLVLNHNEPAPLDLSSAQNFPSFSARPKTTDLSPAPDQTEIAQAEVKQIETKQTPEPDSAIQNWLAGVATPTPGSAEANAENISNLLRQGLSHIGVRYRIGGSDPQTGFDCSGFVQNVFNSALGLKLPRTAREIATVGMHVASENDLKPGDLVFFNTMRRTFSHVGIYLGNGKFVHSPSTGGSVRIDKLSDSYWVKRFNGIRRVLKPR